jgi:hypothetical protein
MRLHQIHRHAGARRIDHAETEAIFGAGRFGETSRRRVVNVSQFGLPFLSRPPAPAGQIAASLLPPTKTPPATGAIFGRKFE